MSRFQVDCILDVRKVHTNNESVGRNDNLKQGGIIKTNLFGRSNNRVVDAWAKAGGNSVTVNDGFAVALDDPAKCEAFVTGLAQFVERHRRKKGHPILHEMDFIYAHAARVSLLTASADILSPEPMKLLLLAVQDEAVALKDTLLTSKAIQMTELGSESRASDDCLVLAMSTNMAFKDLTWTKIFNLCCFNLLYLYYTAKFGQQQ
ncbi:hypothetical protein C8J56DRAFT_882145 [Mycena floridula]|nr:hypothetical protein C8J56DRAFT_882145 [Mycena floridula]